jgi:homoaconitase/3-isopropylmalate dehydratase large subunit
MYCRLLFLETADRMAKINEMQSEVPNRLRIIVVPGSRLMKVQKTFFLNEE